MANEPIQEGEVLSEAAFTADDLARACGVDVGWVHERVQAEVLRVNAATGEWRFDSTTLVRARRLQRLEKGFDADPQLAALTVDLIEEVERLRRRLRIAEGRPG